MDSERVRVEIEGKRVATSGRWGYVKFDTDDHGGEGVITVPMGMVTPLSCPQPGDRVRLRGSGRIGVVLRRKTNSDSKRWVHWDGDGKETIIYKDSLQILEGTQAADKPNAEHRVAIVVFASVPAADNTHAEDMVRDSIQYALNRSSVEPDKTVLEVAPDHQSGARLRHVHVHDVTELSDAAEGGHLKIRPSSWVYEPFGEPFTNGVAAP